MEHDIPGPGHLAEADIGSGHLGRLFEQLHFVEDFRSGLGLLRHLAVVRTADVLFLLFNELALGHPLFQLPVVPLVAEPDVLLVITGV